MRSSSWFDRNNFDDNKEYTIKALDKFDIKKYHFVNDSYGCLALLIELGLNSYRIEVNYDDKVFEIYKKLVRRTGQRHAKEYLKLTKTFDRDCIFNAIKWVKHDSEML